MIDFWYMVRRLAASTGFWRAALSCGLCLLAFLFAVEAKTAWYGPVTALGSSVQASKAMPADTPRVINHGIPVPDPIHPQIAFALLPALTLIWNSTDRPRLPRASRTRLRTVLAVLPPHLFLRPPPALS
ncbi:MAG TPA: hypothetical protein VHD85_13425 [Terracidiphilus sp.]|nr:hypothetical protein [Terracidiphilus sp.]